MVAKRRPIPPPEDDPVPIRDPDDAGLVRFGASAELAGVTISARLFGVSPSTGRRWLAAIEARPDLVERVRVAVAAALDALAARVRETVFAGLDQIRADIRDGNEPRRGTLRAVLLLLRAAGLAARDSDSRGTAIALPAVLLEPRTDTSAPGVAGAAERDTRAET